MSDQILTLSDHFQYIRTLGPYIWKVIVSTDLVAYIGVLIQHIYYYYYYYYIVEYFVTLPIFTDMRSVPLCRFKFSWCTRGCQYVHVQVGLSSGFDFRELDPSKISYQLQYYYSTIVHVYTNHDTGYSIELGFDQVAGK